jgi:mycothiol synthase
VRALAARIEARDGAPPLSDQALAQLGSPAVVHLSIADGYAQLAGDSLELAADEPAYAALLDAAEASADGQLLVWTHGTRTPLAGVLAQRGFTKQRVLHQLLLPSLDNLPHDPALAEGVQVRPFAPDRDEEAWLALNAAAFAHHPEQGQWTLADLRAREAESWFDPAGFLLADRAGELLGFHWTKVHEDGRGEVYVLGVAPQAQGLGLGAALLVRGLRHLAGRGCPDVLLYVDDDNGAAMRLYARYGFVEHDLDVQWAKSL